MRQPTACDSCRHRRIKCDSSRPVCGQCIKGHRQCRGIGFESNRLIIKDETNTVLTRFAKSSRSNSRAPSVAPQDVEDLNLLSEQNTQTPSSTGATIADSDEEIVKWNPVANQRLSNETEQLSLAVFCCQKTVTLRTLAWVMSDAKWVDTISGAMQVSKALTYAVRANAANYLAKAAGATVTPNQAFEEYGSALQCLQKDLYHPVKQKSNETLFTVLLLGIFDIYNGQNFTAWLAHIQGACKIMECNGPEAYVEDADTPSRVFAEYVRGMDSVRAVSQQDETMFGNDEWDALGTSESNKPIDIIFGLYSKIANLIARNKRIQNFTVEEISRLVDDVNLIKMKLERWRQELPAYYEGVSVPAVQFDDPDIMIDFPYDNHLVYVAAHVGHTMNMYKAAILTLNLFLVQHALPSSKLSNSDISLAHEIVMSLPSLYKGAIFLIFPARQAAKVLGRQHRRYIARVLVKVGDEIPIAGFLATILMAEDAN